MNMITIERSDALVTLESLGYQPCPMLPGGDGAVGWITSDGGAEEVDEHFPAAAGAMLPAGALAEPGIVADGRLIALRATGKAREALPPSPLTWDAGTTRTALFRGPDARLSAEFGVGFARALSWQLKSAREKVLERIEREAHERQFTAATRGHARQTMARLEDLLSRVRRAGTMSLLERDVAIALPEGIHLPPVGALPVLTGAALHGALASVGAGADDCSCEEHDPVRDWKNAKANPWTKALLPADCPVDPYEAERRAKTVERAKSQIERMNDQVARIARAAGLTGPLADVLAGDVFDLPDDDSTIKPIAFLMGQDFARGFMTATIAPGGVGKSVLSLVEALSLATGRDLMSADPKSSGGVKERVPVLVLSLEDSPDIVRMRLTAICRFYGISKAEIGGRLRVRCGVELPAGLIVAETTRSGTEIKRPVVDALVATVQRYGIGKVTVDPFISSHAVNENDNSAMQRAAEAWREVAHKGGCSVELIHHSRKLKGERATDEDARGGSSLIAACRFTRALNLMDADSAAHFRMSARDAMGIVGIFRDGKQNLVQRQAGAQWFKLKEQALYNGPGGAPESAVGVPAHWSPKAAVAHGAFEMALIVKALMREPNHAVDPRSPRWIGHTIARVMGKNLTEDRALIKGVIADLEDDELIVVDTVEDQHRRKRKVYILTVKARQDYAGEGGGMTPWGEPTGRNPEPDDEGDDCPF